MEDISWKELVKILYKRRALIIGVVSLAVALSLIYSFFIAVPIYHAQVECQVKGLNTGVYTFEQENHPVAVINELLEQVREPEFMEQVSKSLASKNIQIAGNDLSGVLAFGKGAEENTIIVTASYEVKKDVAQIANTAVDALIKYSSDYLKEKLQQQLVYYGEHVELGKASAEEALSHYKDYLAGLESISKLQSKVDMNEALLVQLKANLISGNIGAGKSRLQLEQDIINLEGEIESLKGKLLDESSKDKLYKEGLKPYLSLYTSSMFDYNRLKLAEEYLDKKSSINILSHAIEPEAANWPNTKFIAAVSLTLGICISFFMALAIEYFKSRK